MLLLRLGFVIALAMSMSAVACGGTEASDPSPGRETSSAIDSSQAHVDWASLPAASCHQDENGVRICACVARAHPCCSGDDCRCSTAHVCPDPICSRPGCHEW